MNKSGRVAQLIEKGNTLCKSGDHLLAIDCYSKAIEIDPEAAHAFYNRSLVFVTIGNHDRAESDRLEAFRIDPLLVPKWKGEAQAVADGFVSMGNERVRIADYDQALQCYQEAVRLEPLLAAAHIGCGLVYFETGNFANSIAAYSEAIRLEPENIDALINRALAYGAVGDYDHAIADLTNILSIDSQETEAIQIRAAFKEQMRNSSK